MSDLVITPKTKVLDLLEAYPQLEEVLIQYAPAFKKLKNPVLRKTVARIATLQQAAATGKVKVEDLINHLRRQVGQDCIAHAATAQYITKRPDWFAAERIDGECDARAMLAAGEHPINQVMADLKKMDQDKIYKLVAPFLPAPLIDKASSLEIRHWVDEQAGGEFNIYFFKG